MEGRDTVGADRLVRFAVPPGFDPAPILDPEGAGEGLPGGLRPLDDAPGPEVFRDLYFDTPAGDLARKGASVRLRVERDGRRVLTVDLREIETPERALVRTRAEAEVPETDPSDALRGDSEPARLLAALIDSDQLSPAFELETIRRTRRVGLDGVHADGPALELRYDTVTVRQGDLSAGLRELALLLPDGVSGEPGELIHELEDAWGVRMTLADIAARARDLLEDAEVGRLVEEVRSAREVAVIAYRLGEIALEESEGRLRIPVGRGMGQEACRRMLREVFGRTRGRIRILGTSAATASRPAMEVWLAEDVEDPDQEPVATGGEATAEGDGAGEERAPALRTDAEVRRRSGGGERVWLPLEEVLGMAGSERVRDPRTLAALQVLARSGLPGRLAAVWSARARRARVDSGIEGDRAGAEMLERSVPDDPDPETQDREGAPASGAARDASGRTAAEAAQASDALRIERVRPSDVPPEHLLNMELSRLAFDERILIMAEDEDMPLLERVRFLGMYGDRQDDFFGTRVAEFKDRAAREDAGTTLDGLEPREQLDAIAVRAHRMQERAHRLLGLTLGPALARHGIEIVPWDDLEEWERRYLRRNYATYVEGMVTPRAFDAAHPFPWVEHLRTALAALIRPRGSGAERLVVMELPEDAPRFVALPGSYRFVPLEEVVRASLPDLYTGIEVVRAHTFRLTRATKLRLHDDEVEDVLRAVEEEIALRPYRPVVRIEVEKTMPEEMRDLLLRELQYESEEEVSVLGEEDVYVCPSLVGLGDLAEIASLESEGLRFGPVEREDALPADRPVAEVVDEGEAFVHFPYHAFDSSVERFVAEAADDPAVQAIKITVYRTNRASRVIEALRRARANGKEAVAMVELKASLDEEKNIEWARSLDAAGIHVVFSPPRFKVHAKIALVVRREGDGLRRQAYIGTGNLNAETAATYVDLGILTADPQRTEEVAAVFNVLTGYSAGTPFESLLVSPFNLRRRFVEMIDREAEHARAGRPAGIRLQMNGLSDRRLIAALYRASQAGVPVQGLVREICSLRPGVEGVSENIRVRSLMGRFLQHARIVHFRNGGDDEYWMGSADWRPRNLDDRVEVVTPVRVEAHRRALDRILDETFEDPNGWEVTSSGAFVRGEEVVGGGA